MSAPASRWRRSWHQVRLSAHCRHCFHSAAQQCRYCSMACSERPVIKPPPCERRSERAVAAHERLHHRIQPGACHTRHCTAFLTDYPSVLGSMSLQSDRSAMTACRVLQMPKYWQWLNRITPTTWILYALASNQVPHSACLHLACLLCGFCGEQMLACMPLTPYLTSAQTNPTVCAAGRRQHADHGLLGTADDGVRLPAHGVRVQAQLRVVLRAHCR